MSRAETKAELTRWQPPRHDFWLAIETKSRKAARSWTGRTWHAETATRRAWGAAGKETYERAAVFYCAKKFALEHRGKGVLMNGVVQVEEGLWFAFYRFERPVWL